MVSGIGSAEREDLIGGMPYQQVAARFGGGGIRFYRKALELLASPGTGRQIPFTIREDLKRAHPLGMLGCPLEDVRIVLETAGTEDDEASRSSRVASLFTGPDLRADAGRKCEMRVELDSADTVLIDMPAGIDASSTLWRLAARSAGARLVHAGDVDPAEEPYRRLSRMMSEIGPTVLVTRNPLYWTAAARIAKRPPIRSPLLRGVVAVGLPHSPSGLAALSRGFGGVPVANRYESAELGTVTSQCREGNMHVTGGFLVEVIHPGTGDGVPWGIAGEIAATTLGREGSPVLRYRTGDIGRKHPSCPCGDARPRLEVLGRLKDMMEFSAPMARVSRYSLEEILYRHQGVVGPYDLKSPEGTSLSISVEMDSPDGAQAVKALGEEMSASIGILVSVAAIGPGESGCWKAMVADPNNLSPLRKPGMERRQWLITY